MLAAARGRSKSKCTEKNKPSHVSGIVLRDCKFGRITKNTWQDPKCHPRPYKIVGVNYGGATVDPTQSQPHIRNISFIITSATQTHLCRRGLFGGRDR